MLFWLRYFPLLPGPSARTAGDPLQMYLAECIPCANVAGVPSLALPGGFTQSGLPVGFQLMGNYFEEAKLFSIGHQFQQLTDYHLQLPPL